MFEIVDRDGAGRIGKWEINGKEVKTPNIAIVINPNKMIVTPKELKEEFGAEIIITNSYIISKYDKLKNEAEEKGLHKMLDWDGPIYTDSGTFQAYSQGLDLNELDSNDVIKFQQKIGSDIVVPVDLFTVPDDDKEEAARKLRETNKRIEAAREVVKDRLLASPIQGGAYMNLRKRASLELGQKADVAAIGGIVPLMEQYRYRELTDVIMTCKQNLDPSKPVHAFGAGHPMVFSLLAVMGVDLFDSAMYSLAAQRGAYLTNRGTIKLEDLREFPCECPECYNKTPDEVRDLGLREQQKFLARHNLYVTFSEIRSIRQAISENRLWELVQQRVRAHPDLVEAFEYLLSKYGEYIETVEPMTKRSALFYSSPVEYMRPEVSRSKKWLKRVEKDRTFDKGPFEDVPIELHEVYPFGQSLVPNHTEEKFKPDKKEMVRKTVDFLYGKGASENFDDIDLQLSRKSGRIRYIFKDNVRLGTIRSKDGFFVPSLEGAKLLKDHMKHIIANDEAVPFVKKGKTLFAKHVVEADEGILPGEEVIITDKGNNIIANGTAELTTDEMITFERGPAVSMRDSLE